MNPEGLMELCWVKVKILMVVMEMVQATTVLHLHRLMRGPDYRVTGYHVIGEVARSAVVWYQLHTESLVVAAAWIGPYNHLQQDHVLPQVSWAWHFTLL
jgi:hypothetical protein